MTTLSQSLLLTVVLAPLAGCIIAGFFGKRVGRKGAQWVTILGVLISFVCSVMVLLQTLKGGTFNATIYEWMNVGSLKMEIGFMVDNLTALLMCVVTFVSLMVHVYTIGYMKDDPGYQRFFSYISLFTFSMLMLVMSNNLLQLFFGWEAVGLVSYLLIGFWYTRPTAIFANLKAFLLNRVGDFGFILGIGLLVAYAGSLNYTDIFAQAGSLSAQNFPGTDWQMLTVACICLFVGAMGKSAQFPLHVWLPDSMEGPTPISALIHAATMVTAGIFMVTRMSPLFELTETALSFVLIIGAITALFMGFLGIVQNDIKRVVAYSTISQLGYMIVALGVSAYPIAIFHLMTHAFFKALLFLAAGSVIIGVHHNQDMRYMGGLRKYMPITWITCLIGALSLIGTPLFSGFYSKDSIIEAVSESHIAGAGFAYWAVIIGVFVTALYTFRMYFLVFHGQERYDQAPRDPHAAHDDHHGHASKPHESPWSMTLPLIALAIPSVIIGAVTIGPLVYGDFFNGIVEPLASHPAMREMSVGFDGWWAMTVHGIASVPVMLALSGVVVAWFCYLLKPSIPSLVAKVFAPVYKLLEAKYFMDWFWISFLGGLGVKLGKLFWKVGDQGVIDGGIVDGSWKIVGRIAGWVRRLQSGYIYHYALAMVIGVFVLMTWFLWLN